YARCAVPEPVRRPRERCHVRGIPDQRHRLFRAVRHLHQSTGDQGSRHERRARTDRYPVPVAGAEADAPGAGAVGSPSAPDTEGGEMLFTLLTAVLVPAAALLWAVYRA